MTTRRAVRAFGVNVFLPEPPADLAAGRPRRTLLQMPAVLLPARAGPADRRQVTDAGWRTARDAIVAATRRTAGENAKAPKPG